MALPGNQCFAMCQPFCAPPSFDRLEELLNIEGQAFSHSGSEPFHRNRRDYLRSRNCSSLTRGANCSCANWLSAQIMNERHATASRLAPGWHLAFIGSKPIAAFGPECLA